MKCPSLKQLSESLKPYRDVIVFMITLLVANYFWKFTMMGDEDGEVVKWFGLNVTAPFDILSRHIAAAVYWLVDLFRDTVTMTDAYSIRFDSGSGTRIIWGCSGLKQSFIWLCLILTVRGGWKQKLWFIPIGWICCYAFNILRIFLITLLIEQHPDWFHMLHDYIFKYLFYGMLFSLWVIFVEKIRPSVSAN
ncbi:MAG: archaeosortase/exosortase family protein [Paludibacteraceae bacterium]|nr:archaeosortase/exosortase family protein [Paludibacteraceae bacterium]